MVTLFLALAIGLPGVVWAFAPLWWPVWCLWRDRNKPQLPVAPRDSIEELEAWHHTWRLNHDADYRELYGEKRETRVGMWVEPDTDDVPLEEKWAKVLGPPDPRRPRRTRPAPRYKRSDLTS